MSEKPVCKSFRNLPWPQAGRTVYQHTTETYHSSNVFHVRKYSFVAVFVHGNDKQNSTTCEMCVCFMVWHTECLRIWTRLWSWCISVWHFVNYFYSVVEKRFHVNNFIEPFIHSHRSFTFNYFFKIRKSGQKRDEVWKTGQNCVPFDVKNYPGHTPQKGDCPEEKKTGRMVTLQNETIQCMTVLRCSPCC